MLVTATAPGGQWIEIPRRPQPDETLCYAYVVPPVSPPLPNLAPEDARFIDGVRWFWGAVGVLFVAIAGTTLMDWRKKVPVAVLKTWLRAPLPDLADSPPPAVALPGAANLLRMFQSLQEKPPVEAGHPTITAPVDARTGKAEFEVELTLQLDHPQHIDLSAEDGENRQE
jgi:hypothetical protein